MLGEAARLFSQPHVFEEWTYTTAVYCDLCSQLLWGLTKTGMHKGFNLKNHMNESMSRCIYPLKPNPTFNNVCLKVKSFTNFIKI